LDVGVFSCLENHLTYMPKRIIMIFKPDKGQYERNIGDNMSVTQHIVGRLVADAEVRRNQAGNAFCNFTVISNYGYGENKGTNSNRCLIVGKRAEGKLPEYLKQGQQVYIVGEQQTKVWTDDSGQKRYDVQTFVGTLELLSTPNKQGGAQQGQQPDFNHERQNDIPF